MKDSHKKSRTPPKGFSPAKAVQWATILAEPPLFIKEKRNSSNRGAKGRGIRYEKKVQTILDNRFGNNYIPGPWLLFSEGRDLRPRYCQPDGILFDFYRGRITIVEIKYNHCALAWWQLYTLYLPVIRKIFGPNWTYSCCEVVKWFDPNTHVPETTRMQKDIEFAQEQDWSVNICNPSRL